MKTWNTVDGPIDEVDLEVVFDGIREGAERSELVGLLMDWKKPSDRRPDRALQLLKAQGRIKYDHHGRRWSVVEGGGK